MESSLQGVGRVLLAIAIFAGSAGMYFGAKALGTNGNGGGVFRFLRGGEFQERPRPEKYTLAKSSPLQLDDVELLARLNQEYSNLIEAVIPAVVSINTTKTVDVQRWLYDVKGVPRPLVQRQRQPGNLGSGVIITDEGHIVTNSHVVSGVDEIFVTLSTGGRFRADIVGTDGRSDLAVLKITGGVSEMFPRLRLANSDEVRVGEMVFAVGNPFGLRATVTQGIISAKERRWSDADTGFFQTDAVTNPGSSGGPLINLRGDVIGLSNFLFSGDSGERTWAGVGLAIPSNDVRRVFEDIMTQGRAGRGYLGIGVEDIYPDVALRLGLKSSIGGVVMEVVPDSPAAHAGLQAEDVIVKFDDEEVLNTTELIERVRRQPVGNQVLLHVIREGEELEITATIGERSTEIRLAGSQRSIGDLLGVDVTNLTASDRNQLELLPETPGVIITGVAKNSPASASLQTGDVIHTINQLPIRSRTEFYRVLNAIQLDRTSTLRITRKGAHGYVEITPQPGIPSRSSP